MELTLEQALQKGVEAHRAGKVEEADRYYTAILKANPKHPDANHNLGVLAIGVGKVETALPFFKAALEANTNIAQFWLSYIDALIKLDRKADAKAVLKQAKSNGAKGDAFDQIEIRLSDSKLSDDDQVNRDILEKAIKLRENGEYDEAISFLKNIITEFPKDPNIPSILSHCYIFSDNVEQAKIYLDKAKNINPDIPSVGWNETRLLLKDTKVNEALAIAKKFNKLFPDDVEGMGILGSCLRATGNLDESLKFLGKAIELNPNYAEALINRGLIRLARDDKARALRDLEKAHKLKPHVKQIWDLLIGLIAETKNYSRAISSLIKMIEVDPSHEKSFSLLIACNKEVDDPTLAIMSFKKILEVRPNDTDSFLSLGVAFQRQGKLEEAIKAFNKALSIKPDYAEAYNNIGTVFQEQGRLEEAIKAYNQAIFIKPDYADVYYNRGVSLKEQGKLEETIKAFSKAISIKPDFAEAYNNMGNAFQEQEKLEAAIEAYTKALSIKPDYAETYFNMGNSLKDQGKLEEAITAYTRALSIKPDFAEVILNALSLQNQIAGTKLINEEFNKKLKIDSLEFLKIPKFQILQAISAFLLNDPKLVHKHLKWYNGCAQSSIAKLKSKDQVFCSAYNHFLQKLVETPIVNKVASIGDPTVFHLGESHCLSYAHKKIKIQGLDHTVTPRITFGGKAYHFSIEKENAFKAITKANFHSLSDSSKVFISFGEIDCRQDEGIISAAAKHKTPIANLVSDTIRGYVAWFAEQNQSKNHSLFFLNVPAPIYDEKYTTEINEEVSSTIQLFNILLDEIASDYGFNLIDIYKFTVGRDRFSNGLFHIDSRHISSNAIPEIEKQVSTIL